MIPELTSDLPMTLEASISDRAIPIYPGWVILVVFPFSDLVGDATLLHSRSHTRCTSGSQTYIKSSPILIDIVSETLDIEYIILTVCASIE